MCYFISVGLPQSVQQKWIELLPPEMHALPTRNEGISQEMKGWPVLDIVTAQCSCDLFNRSTAVDFSKRYEKKGWSKAKIKRAIENRDKSNFYFNLHPDFRRWLADATEDAGKSYLLVHWDSDDLNLQTQAVLSIEEFRNPQTYIRDEQLICINRWQQKTSSR